MIDTQSKQRNIQLGQRVQVQGYVGTVKYIGEVDGHKGVWLGLDWDDESRGKHNGTVNNKHYFTASTPTSGSFLRTEKVSSGINLIDSITSRYGHEEDGEEIKINEAICKSAEKRFNTFLELVGFDGIKSKQSKYTELKVLCCRLQNVEKIGDVHQLSGMCPNVCQLDLSKNLLHSWEDVFLLASELTHLEDLNISENRLEMPADITPYKVPQLKTLGCGSMRLTFKDIECLAQVFNNIETIIAPFNDITNFTTSIPLKTLLQNLESLDIESSPITDWAEVMKLKDLPKLRKLYLKHLQITEIRIDDNDKDAFQTLESLNIRYNKVEDLKSLTNLNKLKQLTSLSILENPIYKIDTHQMVNQIIIGMIGSLQVLNSCNIQDERKGAEIDYMKKFGLQWLDANKSEEHKAKFLQVHPRYPELIRVFGELEEGELKVAAKTIKESLIEVILMYEGKQVRKKIPPNLHVQKLITLCQRLFGLPATPTLVYFSADQPSIEFDMDGSREISLYSVQSGDKIVVKC